MTAAAGQDARTPSDSMLYAGAYVIYGRDIDADKLDAIRRAWMAMSAGGKLYAMPSETPTPSPDVVPREPTETMIDAAVLSALYGPEADKCWRERLAAQWRAMWDAHQKATE